MSRRTRAQALIGVGLVLGGVLGFIIAFLSGPPEEAHSWSWGEVESKSPPTGGPNVPVNRSARVAPERRSLSFATDTDCPTMDLLRVPVKSLVTVRGQSDKHIMGVGLVTGLAGTGDTSDTAKQLARNLLLTRDIHIDSQDQNAKNVAIVRVEADVSEGLKPGYRFSARISAIGDAKSLEGGLLTFTELTGVSRRVVYGTAEGRLTVGGFSARGDAANAIRNHVTVATLPGGCKLEREIETSTVSDCGFIYLDACMGQNTSGNTTRITDVINGLYPGAATSLLDSKTVRVAVPTDLPKNSHRAFLASLLELEVEYEIAAHGLVDESSGFILSGGGRKVPVLAYIPSSLGTAPGVGEVMRSYSVSGMCCESCTRKLHDKALGLEGVKACAVGLVEERVVLIAKGGVASEQILTALNFDKYRAVEVQGGS